MHLWPFTSWAPISAAAPALVPPIPVCPQGTRDTLTLCSASQQGPTYSWQGSPTRPTPLLTLLHTHTSTLHLNTGQGIFKTKSTMPQPPPNAHDSANPHHLVFPKSFEWPAVTQLMTSPGLPALGPVSVTGDSQNNSLFSSASLHCALNQNPVLS